MGTTYQCRVPGCEKSFSTTGHRARHEKNSCKKGTYTSQSKYEKLPDGRLKCKNPRCLLTFAHDGSFSRHLASCGKRKPVAQKRTSRLSIENEINEFSCNQCDSKFKKKSNFNRHIKNVHENKKVYNCQTCGSSYSRIDKFEMHEAACHEMNLDKIDQDLESVPLSFVASTSVVDHLSHANSILSPNPATINSFEDISEPTSQPSSESSSEPITLMSEGSNIITEDFFGNSFNVDISDNNSEPMTLACQEENSYTEDSLGSSFNNEDGTDDSCHDNIILQCFIDDLKALYHPKSGNRTFTDRLFTLFGTKLGSPAFIRFISKKLQIRYRIITNLILTYETREMRKRIPFPKQVRKTVYEFWLKNSVTTVFRSNGRDVLRLSKENYFKINPLYRNDDDSQITEKDVTLKKCNTVKTYVTAVKKIYTKSVRQLHEDFKNETGSTMGLSVFYKCKPFYVVRPTENEKVSCMCITCLNIHNMLDAVNNYKRSLKKDIIESATEYVASGLCTSTSKACIKGECSVPCKRVPHPSSALVNKPDKPKKVSFYIFGPVKETYYNKYGKLESYDRTSRIDESLPIEELEMRLFMEGEKYLLHKLIVLNDTTVFPDLLESFNGIYLHGDFSENIKLTEKKQAQSAHFSGKQSSLHCVVMDPPSPHKYIYHFSDDTNHDGAFVDLVLRDIINYHGFNTKSIMFKTDNCTTQYKSKLPFACYQQLVDEYDIKLFKAWGAPGHGRGLVDSMSSFGCKSPLREAIVTQDKWFPTADSMAEFLKEKFEDKIQYLFRVISKEQVRDHRQKCRKTMKVPGSSSIYMMEFRKEESPIVMEKFCNCENCIAFNFESCSHENSKNLIQVSMEDFNPENEEFVEELEPNEVILKDVIQPDSFIALRSPSNSLELFFLFHVEECVNAKEDITDDYGHTIKKGEDYFKGHYLEKTNELKKFVKYKELKKKVAFCVAYEVLNICVSVDRETMRITKKEYIALHAYNTSRT